MTLKIQIVSDIHAEFWAQKKKFNFIKPSAPILALLGDTCCVGDHADFLTFQRFIAEQLDHFEHIIIVSGNHEYYYNAPNKNAHPTLENTLDACNKKIADFCRTSPKLHYLHNATLTIQRGKKQYLIIGSTLWSDIPRESFSRIQDMMSDYRYIYVADGRKIRNITPQDVTRMHQRNAQYIKSKLRYAKEKRMIAVVLTHHKPYKNPSYDPKQYDCAYESDLTSLFGDPLVAWCYGHTHVKDRSACSGTRLISNPKGYPRQHTNFDPAFVLSV